MEVRLFGLGFRDLGRHMGLGIVSSGVQSGSARPQAVFKILRIIAPTVFKDSPVGGNFFNTGGSSETSTYWDRCSRLPLTLVGRSKIITYRFPKIWVPLLGGPPYYGP